MTIAPAEMKIPASPIGPSSPCSEGEWSSMMPAMSSSRFTLFLEVWCGADVFWKLLCHPKTIGEATPIISAKMEVRLG